MGVQIVQITMISYIIKFLFRIICWKNETSLNSKESFYTTYISKTELLWCFKLHSKAQWTKLDSQSGSFFYSLSWKSQFFFHTPWILKKLQKHCNLHVHCVLILFKILFLPKPTWFYYFKPQVMSKSSYLKKLLFLLSEFLKVPYMVWRILWRKFDSTIDTRILFKQLII